MRIRIVNELANEIQLMIKNRINGNEWTVWATFNSKAASDPTSSITLAGLAGEGSIT